MEVQTPLVSKLSISNTGIKAITSNKCTSLTAFFIYGGTSCITHTTWKATPYFRARTVCRT